MATVDKTKKIMTLDNLTYYDGKIKGYINGKYTEVEVDLNELQSKVDEIESKALLMGEDIIFSAD